MYRASSRRIMESVSILLFLLKGNDLAHTLRLA
jgi:hypothetical protein